MSDITLFFQRSWENLWKEKLLWLFSALLLVVPLIRLIIPIQKSVDFVSSFFNLAESFVSFFLVFVSYTGVAYVAYCIITRNPINIQTALQGVEKFFGRIVASTFLYFLILSPFLCLAFIFSFKQPPQISDFSHGFFFVSIPLSIFTALWYFLFAEIIMNDSSIRKSVKTVWSVFTDHFTVLAGIGIVLASTWYVINVTIGMAAILTQYNFDLTALSKLDYISPNLSFTGNNLYTLVIVIAQTLWRTYSTTIFILAYLKYSSIKI